MTGHRNTIFGTAILGLGILLFAAVPVRAELTELHVTENWVLGGEHIGDFTALAKGFYEAEGLKVKVTRGYGSSDAVKRVAAGATKISRSAAESVISGRAAGAKVKIIFVTFHKGPYATAFLKGKGISRPKDLEGRKVAQTAGASSTKLWPAYGKVGGFDHSKIINIYMGGAAYVPSLIAGKVDATSAWLVNLPAYEKAANQAGLQGKVGYFLWADYGLQLYGSVVIASDKLIESESDLVRRYTRAAMRGFTYAIEHPEEGIDAWMKYNVGRAREVIKGEWRFVLKLTFDKLFEKNGLGYADPNKMKQAVALVDKYLGLKGSLDPQLTYTNEYVKATPREWRFPKRPKM
ncbi:MAG: ABC transporter substrate-binding protein [Nitrospinota bacterium]